MRGVLLLVAAALFCASPAAANDVDKGLKAFNAGDSERALQLWLPKAKSGDPAAQNNMGVLWENGSTTETPQSNEQAAEWYRLSALRGFLPAMSNLARLQLSAGYRDQAKTWLDLAARWNDPTAINMLAANGWPTPAPDLAIAQQQMQQQNAIVAGALVACAVTRSCGSRPTTIVDTGPILQRPVPRECVYWTPQGKRVVQAVNGMCPLNYGQ